MKIITFLKKIHKKYYALGVVLAVFLAIALSPERVVSVFESLASTVRRVPIYCVDTPKKQVALTFDAAWGADDTDILLEILDRNDVKATFFLCGYWVKKYPEEVLKISEAGHGLGNHSSTHPHMNCLTKEQITKELADTHAVVKELTGIEMDLFRPPFGEYNNNVIEAAEEFGYYTIQWDVDSLETKIKWVL